MLLILNRKLILRCPYGITSVSAFKKPRYFMTVVMKIFGNKVGAFFRIAHSAGGIHDLPG